MGKSDDNQGQIEFADYVVALVDVLKQDDCLREMSRLPETREELTSFIDNARKTIGTINALRAFFESYFRSTSDPELANQPAYSDHPHFKRMLEDAITSRGACFWHFSDTMVIYARAECPERGQNVGAVLAMLQACAGIMAVSLSGKVTIRGGIEIGPATPCWSNEIYGYPLAEAYRLENEVAQYPRIAVGDGVCKFLERIASHPGNSHGSPFDKKKQASDCLGLIAADIDGCSFVDFLGAQARTALSHTPELANHVHKAHKFVISEHERFKHEREQKLALRYGLLRSYFEARIADWPKPHEAQDRAPE